MRNECLNEHLFFSMNHTRAVIGGWVHDYNTARPHSSLGYLAPAAFAAMVRRNRHRRCAICHAARACSKIASGPVWARFRRRRVLPSMTESFAQEVWEWFPDQCRQQCGDHSAGRASLRFGWRV
jgi:hypothetical protein